MSLVSPNNPRRLQEPSCILIRRLVSTRRHEVDITTTFRFPSLEFPLRTLHLYRTGSEIGPSLGVRDYAPYFQSVQIDRCLRRLVRGGTSGQEDAVVTNRCSVEFDRLKVPVDEQASCTEGLRVILLSARGRRDLAANCDAGGC